MLKKDENINKIDLNVSTSRSELNRTSNANHELMNKISSPSLWESNSQKTFSQSLSNIYSTYSEIEKTMSEIASVLALIKRYDELRDLIEGLREQYSECESRLYYTEYHEVISFDRYGNKIVNEEEVTMINEVVEANMLKIKMLIEQAELEMKEIEPKLM